MKYILCCNLITDEVKLFSGTTEKRNNTEILHEIFPEEKYEKKELNLIYCYSYIEFKSDKEAIDWFIETYKEDISDD